jgi:hypothetical protein
MTRPRRPGSVRARVSYGVISEKEKKASICMGDELHYVSVLNSIGGLLCGAIFLVLSL